MARAAVPFLGIDAKMYRHFAIVTVALTAGIALLADGEKREAVAQGIEKVAEYEPEKPEEAQLIIKNEKVGSGALDGFYSNAGGDSSDFIGADSGIVPRGLSRTASYSTPSSEDLERVGITLEEFNQLSPEQQAQLLYMLRDNKTAAQREKMIRDATTSSLERSGGGTNTDY